MRVIPKYTASLLVGIVVILTVDAVFAWQREVAFFRQDMRQDHELIADFVGAAVRRTWARDGRDAAMAVPRSIDEGGRHLALRWIDDVGPDGSGVPAALRPQVTGGEPVSARDANYQHTYVPIRGPDGEQLVLDVRESLGAERAFSRSALVRAGTVAAAVLGVSAALTLVLGMLWVGRPMARLCEGAERIGRGDFDGGIADGASDEIGTLARAMNAMSRSLAAARDRVQRETTQRLAALEQLRHADRLATVGQLAAGVAHELGTPLNVVWSMAGMIAKREIPAAEVPESAQTIAEQATHMTAIIRQLLDFARPRKPDKVSVDLADCAQRCVQLLEIAAQKRGVTLRIDGGGTPRADVDPSQLQQVLTNLIVNAVHASRPGDAVIVRVTANAPRPPDTDAGVAAWHRIEVVDTGVGIAADALPRLFEPFFTTKGVGEGTGLGLSVALGIVQENGGRITVASAPGEGSTFAVFLPAGGAA